MSVVRECLWTDHSEEEDQYSTLRTSDTGDLSWDVLVLVLSAESFSVAQFTAVDHSMWKF